MRQHLFSLLRGGCVFLTLLSVTAGAPAATLYWDANGATSGFGTAGGVWGSNAFWNSNSAGTPAPTITTTTTADGLNFGRSSPGLAEGTISVVGTVDAASLTYGSASGRITLSGGTIQLAATSTITANNSQSNIIDSVLTGAGTSLTKAGGGSITLANDASALAGAVNLTSGQIILGHVQAGSAAAAWNLSSSGTTLVANSNLTGAGVTFHLGSLAGVAGSTLRNGGSAAGSNTFSIGALGTNTTFAGTIIDASGTTTTAITKTGGGTLKLTGANTYSGATIIDAGTLQIGDNGTAGTLGTGAVANYATLAINRSDNLTLANSISGSGALQKNSTGNLTLTGDNSGMSGAVTINSGLVALGNVQAGSAAAAWNLAASGTTLIINNSLAGGGATVHLGALSGAAGATLRAGGSISSTNTFSVGALGTDAAFAGNIIDLNASVFTAVTKTGTGAWTLTGANTYTGGTTISGGRLFANSVSGSALGGGGVNVGSGAILGGTGVVAPSGAHGIQVQGALAPGTTGLGTLTLNLANTTGGVSLLPGASLQFDVDAPGVSDLIRIQGFTPGDLVFNSNAVQFTDLDGFSPGLYTLFAFYAADGVTPVNHNLTSGLVFGGGASGTFLYSGNLIQVQLNAIVPEPSSIVLASGALAGLAGAARRTRRKATANRVGS